MLNVFKTTSDDVKKHLTGSTERALACGSFGLPWFVGMFYRAAECLNV